MKKPVLIFQCHNIYISCFAAAAILSNAILPLSNATAQTSILSLPKIDKYTFSNADYTPVIFAGMTVYPDRPLRLDFIVDEGENALSRSILRDESKKLISYFTASLTIPEHQLWVNLSPYEKNRIIAPGLEQTMMGRDMLIQDYLLKQITSAMTHPECEIGKPFWDELYKSLPEPWQRAEISENILNKIWIVPDEAMIYVHDQSVFIADSRLKVMMEEDYLARKQEVKVVTKNTNDQILTKHAKQLIQNMIIPAIEKEVNHGQHFVTLRQIYHSMILATWYKNNLKKSLLGQVYVDQSKIKGIHFDKIDMNMAIYEQYLDSFKKGAYNYIKEDYDFTTQTLMPRRYFSGGKDFGQLSDQMVSNKEFSSESWLAQRLNKSKVMIETQSILNQPNTPETASMLFVLMDDLKDQLPATFSVDSSELIVLNNLPTIDQLYAFRSQISDETKLWVLLASLKNKALPQSVQADIGILQAMAYFRELHPAKKRVVVDDLLVLGFSSSAQWLLDHYDGFLTDLYPKIEQQFGVAVGPQSIAFIRVHDETVRRVRGLRLAMETVSSLKMVSDSRKGTELISSHQALRDVVFGFKNANVVTIAAESISLMKDMLWGLHQIEGTKIDFVHLGDDRYYVYDAYRLKRLAAEHQFDLGITKQGLEHLIKIDMARQQGVFYGEATHEFEGSAGRDTQKIIEAMIQTHPKDRLTGWNEKDAYWRATPLAGRFLEIQRSSIETIYMATKERPVAFRQQLEAEAEANRIFNRQVRLVLIDDSSPEVIEKNKQTLRFLLENYGWQSWHITPEMREKEFDAYANDLITLYQKDLEENRLDPQIKKILTDHQILKEDQMDQQALRSYLVQNVFFHISGVRNRTLLKARGESVIMSMDDDAPSETYVLSHGERRRVRAERLDKRTTQMRTLIKEVNKILKTEIRNEQQLYEHLAGVDDQSKNVIEELLNQYFGYHPDHLAGKIPLAMGEIKGRDDQLLDQDSWGKALGISHQRYHGLMTPLAKYMLTMSDFVYQRPRTEKKQGHFEVLPVNVHRMGDLVGQSVRESQLPLMGSPLDGKGDLRGTMAQPIDVENKNALLEKVISYVAAPFIEDQDTSAVAQFIRYLQMKQKSAANLQHADQSALILEGVGGFVADSYVIFNRAALSNAIVSPSIGRDLRLEEPPYILWVQSPMQEGQVTVAYSPLAGGQQREIGERIYDINHQDYTEVVGVVARSAYEKAVRIFYDRLSDQTDLQGSGKHYDRLRVLGQLFMEQAESFVITKTNQIYIDQQRITRAMMLAELSKQKSELIKMLRDEPLNQSLVQEIRDMDLIFTQYAQSFFFYETQNQSELNYKPKDPDDDFFYWIEVKENIVLWKRVRPDFTVTKTQGVKMAQQTAWHSDPNDPSGEIKRTLLQSRAFIEVEPDRFIILSEVPEVGDDFIVPVLTSNRQKIFEESIEAKVKAQIRSDGELLLVWPDLVGVAKSWHDDKRWSQIKSDAVNTMSETSGSSFNTKINPVGGIDFAANHFNLETQGSVMDMTITHNTSIQTKDVISVSTAIIKIIPMTNYPFLLGVAEGDFILK